MIVEGKLFVDVIRVLGDEQFCQVGNIYNGICEQDYFVYIFDVIDSNVFLQVKYFMGDDYQGKYYCEFGEDCICNEIWWEDCGVLIRNN